ncbi:DUF1572 domain-containing protein [Alkalihalobacillus sp. AL-G]|uniref:DUF1572 domain-containing protein n=1 Tax=Alkalihalobacillus sp. AL-G TaxID=2926399 RepID=UPI00272B78BE|nr:DUF1572 domain-containing protein [Alkalihalobacillus sp. AL-G]WLD92318.1 DUF1572 domain-containing protein [Alkalihalobacillus sp. AL-G]
MTFEKEYLRVVKERFRSTKNQGEKAIHQLSEDDIHWVLNDASNSVAVIVKHLSGNMVSRWTDFLTTDGEKISRNRDHEFQNTISSKQELMEIWEKGWKVLFKEMDELRGTDLMKTIYIRGEGHTALDAIERQMAHYASHIGQIVYIGKQLKGENWKSLSIPKGKSEEFLQQMLKKHQ